VKRTILELVRAAVTAHADRVYMTERRPEGYMGATYRQTAQEAANLGAFFVTRGLQKGDRVSLLSEGRNAWIVAELGVLSAGAVCVPISTKLNERDEILFRLKHSRSRFVIVSERQKAKVLPLIPELPALEGVLFMDPASDDVGRVARHVWADAMAEGERALSATPRLLEEIRDSLAEDDPATLLYTSGTTAEPKGIMLSHRNYVVNVLQIQERVPLAVGSSTLLILPWDHSFAHTAGLYNFLNFGGVVAALEVGNSLVATMRNIPKNLQEVGPDFLVVVPALAESFRRSIEKNVAAGAPIARKLFAATVTLGTRVNGDGFRRPWDPISLVARLPYSLLRAVVSKKVRHGLGGKLQFIVSGGSGIALDHVRWFSALGVPIYQGYGLSETSPVISACSYLPRKNKMGSSGRPFPWADVRIVDDSGRALPPGESGEIAVKGECVMLGYFDNPGATAEAIRDGYFHTGDLGHLDRDGFLFITGRIKSLLVGQDGEKYSPEGLELHITEHVPFAEQVMLYNQQSPYTVALVVVSPERVVAWMREKGLEIGGEASLDAALGAMAAAFRSYKEDAALSSRFIATWTPRTFAVLPEPFSEENRMINSTLKMVRRTIASVYTSTIASLYAESAEPVGAANRVALRGLLDRAGAR
jgi:long-chain acyl-CoA synthetase